MTLNDLKEQAGPVLKRADSAKSLGGSHPHLAAYWDCDPHPLATLLRQAIELAEQSAVDAARWQAFHDACSNCHEEHLNVNMMGDHVQFENLQSLADDLVRDANEQKELDASMKEPPNG